MADPDTDLASAAARFLDLPLAPEHLPGVAANLALLRTHAQRIAILAPSREVEPAPVFAADGAP